MVKPQRKHDKHQEDLEVAEEAFLSDLHGAVSREDHRRLLGPEGRRAEDDLIARIRNMSHDELRRLIAKIFGEDQEP